ncbi:incA protein domain-containing protein [Purpureocillium lavendulum]|uniref:IncA protein domain-containing protein n=1 Tax=Purpureocillium lavendulum TaxID=1247861 RepID=A0AB34FHQ1_9HYPO|nr:incA protein domain-containing protein [Purpureocillium lavendulum]
MDHNIQESDAAGRKRNHDEFAADLVKTEDGSAAKSAFTGTIRPTGDSCASPPPPHFRGFADRPVLAPISNNLIQSSPHGSPALTDTGSSTPARNSPSPLTPTKTSSSSLPNTNTTTSTLSTTAKPTKPKKLTPEEKAARDKEAADRKKEREEKAALKAAEKAKLDEEKAAKAAIKAVEQAKLEEEKAARAKEREEKRKKKEAEDAVKAEKKRQKEEEKKRAQEELDKKERQQMRLSFFVSSKKPAATRETKLASPEKPVADSKPPQSAYEKLFRPFYVRENTRWTTPASLMDEETRNAKSRILDEYIAGQRAHETKQGAFDSVELLSLPSKPSRRGRLHHPVRHIMEKAFKEPEKAETAGGSTDNALIRARKELSKVPMKVIAFSQDVRPPYYGTVTFKPFAMGSGNMYRLARKTTDRRLPLDYDYDSEAEWQDEEGEDVDMDDDDEDLDDEDDMDGFLDDSEDAGLARRVFANTMEPESTGICFEDHHRLGPNRSVYEHKMEFMHEGLSHTWGIDPWSGQYWETEQKSKAGKAAQPSEGSGKMAPPPAPANAFAALGANAGAAAGPVKVVKSELLNDVKRAILDNKALSKAGTVDFIFHQLRGNVSRAEVKNTIEMVAEKTGSGRTKEWSLRPGHEIRL